MRYLWVFDKAHINKSVVEIVEGTMKSMGKKACAKCCLEWVKETGARTPENEEAQKHE